jgi:colanic acid biosynthesis glycosyl transferase WcaI
VSDFTPARIAILGLNYAPEEVGIGPFTRGMAEGLAALGHPVKVICGQPYYPQWKRWPGYAGGWTSAEESGVTVTRCPHYVPAIPGGLKRVIHLASFTLSALFPAFAEALRRPRLVICIAPALLSVPVAWLAAKLAGAKLWVHVQDFEVEAALATGLVKQGKAAGFARWMEGRLLRLADCVSTISPQMCAKLLEKGVEPDRAIEVRNWANASQPDPENGAAYRAEWGLGTKRVALYSGNIANKQGIEIIIEAARLLAQRDDLAFVICGEGPNRARLEALAEGLKNVQFHNLQPAARMGELLALADIHLLPQIAGAADLVLPSKLANMLWSGRPVVATAAADTGLRAEVEGCGVATEPGDAKAFSDAIAGLLDDPTKAKALGNAGELRAAQRWSKSAIIAQMETRMAKLAP